MVSASLALKLDPARFDHGYCQASGFFLAFAIEASDYAILVIAIHSALCIFRPNTNLGETGLFSIRYVVYALWIALPVLAAGLGFLHGGVYISTGAYCYLPVRPFWYRLGLSWVPRYVIFVTILTLYAMIYWFVSAKFKNFHRSTGDSYKRPSEWAQVSASRRAVSHLLNFWGEKDDKGNPSEAVNGIDSQIKGDNANAIGTQPSKGSDTELAQAPAWEHYTFGNSTTPLTAPKHDDITPAPSQRGLGSVNHGSVSTQRTSVPEHIHGEVRKSLIEFLQEEPPEGLLSSPPVLNSALVTEEVVSDTRARQTAIKRQLRFMFIYPLVYLISWIPPSVQHFTLYNDAVAARPNFSLACVSTCFVALQCFFDSFVFSYRETPWRFAEQRTSDLDTEHSAAANGDNSGHGSWLPFGRKGEKTAGNEKAFSDQEGNTEPAPRSQSSTHTQTPRSSFIHRVSNSFRNGSEGTIQNRLSGSSSGKLFVKTAGKSRAETIAEARAARHRRELEKETAREGQEERQRQRKQSILRRGGADRSWWEVEGRKRKDSVLLGLENNNQGSSQITTTTKNAPTTATDDNIIITSPNSSFPTSSSSTSLFSPRRFKSSFSSSSPHPPPVAATDLSPRSRLPLASGDEVLSPTTTTTTTTTDQGGGKEEEEEEVGEVHWTRSASLFLPSAAREQEQAMATVKEEDD